jgi:tetratricopeptide (TPR) repeat protein
VSGRREGAGGAGAGAGVRASVALAMLAAAFVMSGAVLAASPELTKLEGRAKGFYEDVAAGRRERAAGEWAGLEADLAAYAGRLRSQLDAMRDEVMERDGDLEELYRSPRWRQPEIDSLVATYHLAWVRYQGAQLVSDAAKKRKLLQQAVDGFSQFLLVQEVPEIYAESLYGRGLAFMDLGEWTKATEDLRAASETAGVGAKAKAALAEVQRRARGGKPEAPAPDDPATLLGRLGELLPRAAAGDASAEQEAATLARGLAARGGEWPAKVAAAIAERLGGGEPAAVRSSFGLWLLAQLAVDRGRCGDVPALATASDAVHDAGRPRHRPELLFLAGGCALNAGHPREAAAAFATLLREHPEASRAREAAYFRFRALDLARGADPALVAEYEQALHDYLARFGHADGASEAHFLLGELHRARNECGPAAKEYAAVTGAAFAARARLGALECRVSAVVTAGDAASPADRRALAADLRTYARDTDDRTLAARAALLGALVAAGGREPDHALVLELTDGYAERYPEAKALHAEAADLRLESRIATGDLAGAARDVDGLLARAEAGPERTRLLRRVSLDLQRRAERDGDDVAAMALARRVQGALADATDDPHDRVVEADLALRAGDVRAARALYERVLARDPGSAEARRGAARAAAAAGDPGAALAYWKQVLDDSPPGGTAWYEARLAQVTLLAGDGQRAEACDLIRSSRGRATSAGGDQLEARLRSLESDVCR